MHTNKSCIVSMEPHVVQSTALDNKPKAFSWCPVLTPWKTDKFPSKSVLASTRLEDPSKKGTSPNSRGRPNRHQSLPAPRERGLIQPFFRYAGPWTPSCDWRGFWPYRGMSRRIPDRQPRLGLATCVRQK